MVDDRFPYPKWPYFAGVFPRIIGQPDGMESKQLLWLIHGHNGFSMLFLWKVLGKPHVRFPTAKKKRSRCWNGPQIMKKSQKSEGKPHHFRVEVQSQNPSASWVLGALSHSWWRIPGPAAISNTTRVAKPWSSVMILVGAITTNTQILVGGIPTGRVIW